MDKILSWVGTQNGISIKNITSASRRKEFVISRDMFIHIAYKRGFGISAIARIIKKDHTTVIHSLNEKRDREYIKDILVKSESLFIEEPVSKLERYNPKSYSRFKWLYDKYHGKCAICNFDEVVEVHHMIPRYLGGTDHPDNLILLCPSHHALADRGMLFINKDPTQLSTLAQGIH